METVDLEWLQIEPALPSASVCNLLVLLRLLTKTKNVNAVNGSYMLQTIQRRNWFLWIKNNKTFSDFPAENRMCSSMRSISGR